MNRGSSRSRAASSRVQRGIILLGAAGADAERALRALMPNAENAARERAAEEALHAPEAGVLVPAAENKARGRAAEATHAHCVAPGDTCV